MGRSTPRWPRLAAIVLLSACRIGFDAQGDANTASDVAGNDASMPAGLLVWLRMDDGISDRIATDSSGNGNDFSCEVGQGCPAEVSGHTGTALSGWSGTAPGIELPDAPSFHLANFTLAAWVRQVATGAANVIIGKPYGASTDDSFQLEVRDTGPLACAFFTGSTTARATAASAMPIGTWTHVACTYDQTRIRLYINGIADASTLDTGVPPYDSQKVYVGCDRNSGAPAAAFDGDIDDVRIYNVPLSAAEIASIAQ
jgi:hypothetical protein